MSEKSNALKKAAFLEALSEGVTVTRALELSAMVRSTAYAWRNSDAEFALAWEDVHAAGTDMLIQEAQRRAVNGTIEPQFYKGALIAVEVRKYSDVLLMMLMKARDPERFCEKARTAKLLRKWADDDAAAGKSTAVPADIALQALERIASAKAATA